MTTPTHTSDTPLIILDVWGGPGSADHIARRLIADPADAMRSGISELEAGFLVNLRSEPAWGGYSEFDHRIGMQEGTC